MYFWRGWRGFGHLSIKTLSRCHHSNRALSAVSLPGLCSSSPCRHTSTNSPFLAPQPPEPRLGAEGAEAPVLGEGSAQDVHFPRPAAWAAGSVWDWAALAAPVHISSSLPAGQPLGPRRLSQKPVPKLPNMEAFLSDALVKLKKQARGCLAPELCFQAVRACTQQPFAAGVRRERELFGVLLGSGQARALQYLFFAERAMHRWATATGASWQRAAPQPVRTAAVIGKAAAARSSPGRGCCCPE